MGKGGKTQKADDKPSPKAVESKPWTSPYNPLDPKAPPLPSKGEILAVIPPECFERSMLRSFGCAFRDCAMSAAVVYITNMFLSTDAPAEWSAWLLWRFAWVCYAVVQGTILTGLWVVAHECGHGAFSDSKLVNDVVGFILHHALLVPYFPWQFSHAKHHKRTNDLVDGETHCPMIAEEYGVVDGKRVTKMAEIHPFVEDEGFAVIVMFVHLFIGWPLYLLGVWSMGRLGADGKPFDGRVPDHFRPNSSLFPPKMRGKVVLSTATMLATFGLLFKLSMDYSFMAVALWYLYPYVVINVWLVLYTWLQHTDPSVPHFGADEWSWMRGALSTIDRPYGIFDFFHHKIGSTHVVHHLFHEMPHYNAHIATAAVKAYLEPKGLYNYNPEPFWECLWRIANRCHYVESADGVQYYKSLNDLPLWDNWPDNRDRRKKFEEKARKEKAAEKAGKAE